MFWVLTEEPQIKTGDHSSSFILELSLSWLILFESSRRTVCITEPENPTKWLVAFLCLAINCVKLQRRFSSYRVQDWPGMLGKRWAKENCFYMVKYDWNILARKKQLAKHKSCRGMIYTHLGFNVNDSVRSMNIILRKSLEKKRVLKATINLCLNRGAGTMVKTKFGSSYE